MSRVLVLLGEANFALHLMWPINCLIIVLVDRLGVISAMQIDFNVGNNRNTTHLLLAYITTQKGSGPGEPPAQIFQVDLIPINRFQKGK